MPDKPTVKRTPKVPGRDAVTGKFIPAPRTVPMGFAPGQTANQIILAR